MKFAQRIEKLQPYFIIVILRESRFHRDDRMNLGRLPMLA